MLVKGRARPGPGQREAEDSRGQKGKGRERHQHRRLKRSGPDTSQNRLAERGDQLESGERRVRPR